MKTNGQCCLSIFLTITLKMIKPILEDCDKLELYLKVNVSNYIIISSSVLITPKLQPENESHENDWEKKNYDEIRPFSI